MNIILRELKANFKSYIIWSLSFAVIYYFASLEFRVFSEDPSILAAMDSFEFFFEILGSSLANITTPEGYLSILSIYILLPAGIFGAMLGSGIIAKEERAKTAEFLYTLPISRWRVLAAKTFVALFYIVLFAATLCGSLILIFQQFDLTQGFYDFMYHMAIGIFFIELIFMSIGMMLSAVLKQYKLSGSITVGVLVVMFMLSMLMGMTDKVDFLKYVTPFQFFTTENMLNNTTDVFFVILASIISVASISVMFVTFRRRDLYI